MQKTVRIFKRKTREIEEKKIYTNRKLQEKKEKSARKKKFWREIRENNKIKFKKIILIVLREKWKNKERKRYKITEIFKEIFKRKWV